MTRLFKCRFIILLSLLLTACSSVQAADECPLWMRMLGALTIGESNDHSVHLGLTRPLPGLLGKIVDKGVDALLRAPTGVAALSAVTASAAENHPEDKNIYGKMTRALGLTPEFSPAQLAKIPKKGPLIVYANHPLGGAEVFALGKIIKTVRPDVKLVANKFLEAVPGMSQEIIPVDMTGGDNSDVKQEGKKWLDGGHVLIIFPAGQFSYKHGISEPATDPQWQGGIAKFLTTTNADVVPVFFEGQPSYFFSFVRRWSLPASFLISLPELFKHQNTTVKMAIGDPISGNSLRQLPRDSLMPRLRSAVYSLQGAAGRPN